MTRRDLGLTLLELVVATAIFALVGMMAVQALGVGLIQRRVIETADTEQAALMRALALLRQDFESAVPVPHHPASGPIGQPFEIRPGTGFALSRAGVAPLPGAAGDGMARIVWRLDANAGRLLRQSLPLTGSAGSAGPEIAMLDGVTALSIAPRGAWMGAPAGLPPGFELRLDTRRFGSLRVVVAR